MRTRKIRVLALSVVLVSSFALAAAPPARERERGVRERDEPPIVKIVKKLKRGLVSLGDSLTIPKP